MKSAQREAMRQKARSKWGYVEGASEEDEIAELLDWHQERMTWSPTAEEVGLTPEYFAANPDLPF